MNAVVFIAYVEQVLGADTLPGDIVVMDNLPAHKTSRRPRAIQAVRRRTPVPAALFSPDFNPIENAFAKFKITAAQGRRQNYRDLGNSYRRRLPLLFTPEECSNYFQAAGYAST